jgi:hypothetical protein
MKLLQLTTGLTFFAATVLNVRKYGFDPATTCSLISGSGFFISTLISLRSK